MSHSFHKLSDYSYTFPPELIATQPTAERANSRLMVLDRKTQSIAHQKFTDITDYFESGDVLVLNNSKVFPCRLVTTRASGGRQEILLLRRSAPAGMEHRSPQPPLLRGVPRVHRGAGESGETWHVLINASSKVRKNDSFEFDNLKITILADDGNERDALLEFSGDLFAILESIGHIPLPPYLQREDNATDKTRYQTVFAKTTGSVAAPTAGLHFTPEILEKLKSKGVQIVEVTLHVGLGTFLPVRTDNILEHKMHSEFFTIEKPTCDILNAAKQSGKKITAVGTTATRVLETLAQKSNDFTPTNGETDIFIYSPYEFKAVDQLITNFHQPESTLLMLVSAFAGHDFVMRAYQEAIAKKYRLFSYGDCMVIV